MKHKLSLILIPFLALALAACQEAPQQQIDLAKQSLVDAENAGAATWAGTEYEAAKASLAAANAEVETQNGKFALFRNYEQANKLLTEASDKAAAASTAAAENKAAAKTAAETAQTETQAAVAAAQAQLTTLEGCKRKPKGFQADLDALKARLDALVAQSDGIAGQISSEDYNGAQATATAVRDQLGPLSTDLQGAIDKLKC